MPLSASGSVRGLDSSVAQPNCPACRRQMVTRVNSEDHSLFWGCPAFPRCQGVRNAIYEEAVPDAPGYGPAPRPKRESQAASLASQDPWTKVDDKESDTTSVATLSDDDDEL